MVQAKTAGAAARVFIEQPERLAAAWRSERFDEQGGRDVPNNLLDGVVEDLIRQIGRALAEEPGHPWSRVRGVLRVSTVRGPEALADEFDTLRRCLYDALAVIKAAPVAFATVTAVIHDACASATALARRVEDPSAPPAKVPFGGLVVELIEAAPRPHVAVSAPARAACH